MLGDVAEEAELGTAQTPCQTLSNRVRYKLSRASNQALARAGRLDEARLAFETMLAYANHVGLSAQRISRAGQQQGSFPRR